MKKSTKLFFLMATVVMFTALLAISAFAEIYTGNCGTDGSNVTYKLNTITGLLEITGTGAISNYNVAKAPWYSNSSYVKTVKISDGVTIIGDYAFYGCFNITSVTISDNLIRIGNHAFQYCQSLEGIKIPKSVESIGSYVFSDCYNLKTLFLYRNSIANSYFTNAGYTIIYLNEEPIASPESDFRYSINEDGASVTIIGYVGTGGNVVIPSIIADYSVTSIGDWAFSYCRNINSIIIPDSVISIGEAAFVYCSILTSVTIPNSVTSIGEDAFWGCSCLKSVTIPYSVTNIGSGAFYLCSSLAKITIPNSVTINSCSTMFAYCSSLTSVTLPDGITGLDWYAFTDCYSLASITIPNSVTSIDVGVFYNCSNLTSVIIPDSVISIGTYAFYNCSNLASVTIPDSVTSIDMRAFFDCSSLKSVTIPQSVTSIGEDVFYACDNLTAIYVVKGSYAEKYCLKDSSLAPYVKYYGGTNTGYIDKDVGSLEISGGNASETSVRVAHTIILKNSQTGKSISSAKVTLDGSTVTTGINGTADFTNLKPGTVPLSITATGYNGYSVDNFTISDNKVSSVIKLDPLGVECIIPKTCNDVDISTSYAQINNKADLYAKISVTSSANSKVVKYQLKQGRTLLDESTTGNFSVKNSEFEEGSTIVAYAFTEDGRSFCKELNINIISFGFVPTWFLDFNETTITPVDVQFLNGMKLTIDDDPIMEVDFELTNDTCKIGYNHEVKGKKIDEIEKKLQYWLKERGQKNPTDFEFRLCGYVVMKIGNYGGKDITHNIYLVGSCSKTFQSTVIAFSVPVNLEVEIELSGEAKIKITGFDVEKLQVVLPALDLTINGEITGRAGLGCELISAGVYGKLGTTLDLNVLPKFMVDTWKINGEFGFYGKVLCLKADFPLLSGELTVYDKDASTYEMRSQLDYYDPDYYVISAKEFMSAVTIWNETSDGLLTNHVDSGADPQIASTDDVTVMAYISDEGDDEYNYSQLVYSVYSENGWVEPEFVGDSMLSDADFELYSDGNDIWIAYVQANRAITSADDMNSMAETLEIVVSKFDKESGKFGEPTIITSNNTADMNAQISVVNGIPTLVWINNSDNNIFGMSANNTIFMSRYENGAWSAPEAFAESVPAVVSLDIGTLEDELCIAVIHDSDSDFNTIEDKVLTIYSADGEVSSYDDAGYENVYFDENVLYLYADSSIYSIDTYEGEAELISDALTVNSSSDFEIVTFEGKKHILYRVYNTEGENGGCDIYAIINDGTEWSNPVRLTTTEGYVDSFAAMTEEGGILSVYRKTNVTFTDEGMETSSELYSKILAPKVVLSIENIDYDHEDLFGDDSVTLKVTVANKGMAKASGFSVSAGSFVQDYSIELAPGASTEVELAYTLSGETSLDVVVTDENGVTATEKADIFYFDFEALAEHNVIGNYHYINATVKNNGNISGSGTFNIYVDDADGKLIYSEDITLEANAHKFVLLEIVDDTVEKVYVEFVPSAGVDYFEDDNDTTVEIIRSNGFVNTADFMTFEGYQVRDVDYNGLRSLFTVDFTAMPTLENGGFEVIEVGAIFASAEKLETNGDEFIVAKGESGAYETVSYGKIVPIMKNGTLVGKYISKTEDELVFACTVTNFDATNYGKLISSRGYAVLADADGNEYVVYCDYEFEEYRSVSLEMICDALYEAGQITEDNISCSDVVAFRKEE